MTATGAMMIFIKGMVNPIAANPPKLNAPNLILLTSCFCSGNKTPAFSSGYAMYSSDIPQAPNKAHKKGASTLTPGIKDNTNKGKARLNK